MSGPAARTLTLDGEVRLAGSSFRFALDLAPGAHVAVVGPNGAGKSTLLRTLGGLLRLSTGRLTHGAADLDRPETGTFLPAHKRRIALQMQDGALFPHLSALDNVAFPLRARRVTRSTARHRAGELLDRLGAVDLAKRRPGSLSGGQAAKVALARSLAAEPEVLLLDEPAASLDVSARAELRHILAGLDQTIVTVTHDPIEARLLGNQLVVVSDGATVQVGTPEEIAVAPASRWVAGIVDVNIVTGVADGTDVVSDDGPRLRIAEHARGPVHITFPATAVVLHEQRPTGSARNVFEVTVTALAAEEDRVRVAFNAGFAAAAVVTRTSAQELGLTPGRRLWASVKATEMSVLPA